MSSKLRLAGLATHLAASVAHVFGLAARDTLPGALWHSLTPAQQSRTNLRWHAPSGAPPGLRRDHHPSWLVGCSRRSLDFLIEAATGSPGLAPLLAPLAGATTCPLCSVTVAHFPDDMWSHFCHGCPPVTTLAQPLGLAWILQVVQATSLGFTLFCAAGPLTDLMRAILRQVSQVVPVGDTTLVQCQLSCEGGTVSLLLSC